jgi:hypothetical protein
MSKSAFAPRTETNLKHPNCIAAAQNEADQDWSMGRAMIRDMGPPPKSGKHDDSAPQLKPSDKKLLKS